MPKSPTKSSLPKLSELAKHVIAPAGVTSTGWPAVEAKCRDLGVTFRPWQLPVGRLILAKRASGKYAATVGGTGMSIPRQVGKTFLVGAIVFALCLLRPNLTVIWTAHRLRTSEETFKKMQAFARRKRVEPFVRKVTLGSGEEAIEFTNGSRILFGARERGFGRGFDEVDVLIFDEAQILTENALDDMIPATNQSRQECGALLLFMGTPPKPADPGEVFKRMRTEALTGEDEDTGWVEFGADDGFEPTEAPGDLTSEDWRQVARANPSHPEDTPREAILRMRKKLGPDSFLREGLGLWDVDTQGKSDPPAIDLIRWGGLARSGAAAPDRATLWIDVTPDRSMATIGVAGPGDDDRVLLLEYTAAGIGWVVPKIKEIRDKRTILEVALVPTTQAGALIPALTTAGIEFEAVTPAEAARSCGWLPEAVLAGTVEHVDQPELNKAVAAARTKQSGEQQKWIRPYDPSVPISPVVAVAGAGYRWATGAGSVTYYASNGVDSI